MGLVKTTGIVLRETKYGEHDKMLTVFTEEFGTIGVAARGVRGKNRRYTGAGLFCYSRFVLFQGRTAYSLNDCELIHSFYSVCDDLFTMSCGAYLCEITSGEQLPNRPLMKLLLNALVMLERKKPVWLVKGVFELRAAAEFGFAPGLFHCIRCGKRETAFFSGRLGGVICEECQNGERKISKSVLNAMQFVQTAENPFSFSLSEEWIPEFSFFCETFLLYHLEKQPKTLAFLKSLF